MTDLVHYDQPPELIAGLPRHNLDAEGAVLSAIMNDQPRLAAVVDLLQPKHFYSESHAQIYAAILALHARESKIDIVTVGSELKATDRIQQVGGMGYLVEVLNSSPVLANVRAHAEIVYECWRIREVGHVAYRIAAAAYTGISDSQGFLDAASRAIANIARATPTVMLEDADAIMAATTREISDAEDRAKAEKVSAQALCTTGVPTLDRVIGGGLTIGKHMILAWSGVGKTVLGLQACMANAQAGHGAIFWSVEMSRKELGARILSQVALVDSMRVSAGMRGERLTEDEWRRIAGGIDARQRMPLYMHASVTLTAEDICAQTRIAVERAASTKNPIRLMAVDYLQKLKPSPSMIGAGKHMQVEHATRLFTDLAQELKIAVLELAQRKPCDKRDASNPPEPGAGECYYSAQPEQDAHCVIYLHRPEAKRRDRVKALVTKNRTGPIGSTEITLEGPFSRFVDPRDPMLPASRQFAAPRHFYEGDDL